MTNNRNFKDAVEPAQTHFNIHTKNNCAQCQMLAEEIKRLNKRFQRSENEIKIEAVREFAYYIVNKQAYNPMTFCLSRDKYLDNLSK